MLDPKLHRTRKLGRDWKVQTAPDKVMRKCSACMCKVWPGEATVVVHHHWMHRQCLKEWLESTYLQVPPQPDEVERTSFGPADVVDEFRLEREFQAYRQQLLKRLGVESAGHAFEELSS